jgi:ABC-type sugar transport system substrate-binding protein
VVGDTLELTEEELAVLAANAPGKLIGVVATTLETEYHALLNETLQARGEELGFTVEIFDSQTQAEREIQGFEGFVSKGAVAIVVTGIAGEALGPIVQEATDAGIVVVQVTGRALSEFGALTVAVENTTIGYEEGLAAGAYAAATYPGEEVEVIILDYPDFPSLVVRADEIERGMLEANPSINVVGRFIGGLPDNGVTSTETALQQFPNLKGITGINDGGNMGAYQALLAAGRTPEDTFIFGIDCDPGAVDLIDQGTMYKGCIDTNPAGTGVIAINTFAKYWAGGTVPEIIEVPVVLYTGP